MHICTCSQYHPPSEGTPGGIGYPTIAGGPRDACGVCDGYRPFQGAKGAPGMYGPNDLGYINLGLRLCAHQLVSLTRLYSEGHYAHSNAKLIPQDHPLVVALKALEQLDKETAPYANKPHEPTLFEPYKPSIENQTRWDHYQGEPGSQG